MPEPVTQSAVEIPLSPQTQFAEEEKNQEEADTEVSQINTQSKSEIIQETYSRPMSTASMTPVIFTMTAPQYLPNT